MKCSFIALCSALTLSIIALGSKTSHAQAWRCSGDMCEDFIINDIEDYALSNWSVTQTLAMPGLPYNCETKLDVCPHCATKGALDTTDALFVATRHVTGTVPWSITLTAGLRSFLIGSFSASADVLGAVRVSADGSSWPGTEINYVFHDTCDANNHCAEVPQLPSGTTGVADLGPVSFATLAGSVWGASLIFEFDVNTSDIIINCSVGYEGKVNVDPGDRHVVVSYPAGWTPLQGVVAEAIRNLFRAGARAATM
jgi:hypothetical protein